MFNNNYAMIVEQARMEKIRVEQEACKKYFAYCAKTAWYNKKKKVKR